MGKAIDFDKPLSDEDKAWLRSRSRSWQIDEHERRLADKKSKGDVEPVDDEFPPPYTVGQPPFDEPTDNTRQVPRPVGEHELLDSPGEKGDGAEDDLEDWTVDELKDELRERDLPVSGNKDELVKRLKEADK
jgi:hypothetical protein